VHDGQVIFESGPDTQDVARYVDLAFCGGRLFPAEHEGLQQILISYLENEVEGVTFRLADIHYVPAIEDLVHRVMVIRHKERKFGRGCVDAWRRDAHKLQTEAVGHFDRFDQMLQNRPFLLGEEPVYTDFLFYGIIGNYTFQRWNALPASLAAVDEWRQRMAALKW